jgi:hypothetical protein
MDWDNYNLDDSADFSGFGGFNFAKVEEFIELENKVNRIKRAKKDMKFGIVSHSISENKILTPEAFNQFSGKKRDLLLKYFWANLDMALENDKMNLMDVRREEIYSDLDEEQAMELSEILFEKFKTDAPTKTQISDEEIQKLKDNL